MGNKYGMVGLYPPGKRRSIIGVFSLALEAGFLTAHPVEMPDPGSLPGKNHR